MKHQLITPQELKNIQSNSSLVLIDVREPDEWQELHIVGATLIPLANLTQQIDKVCPDKNQPIYLYCARGRRSQQAAILIHSLGYQHVFELEGGIFNWVDAGLPCQTC